MNLTPTAGGPVPIPVTPDEVNAVLAAVRDSTIAKPVVRTWEKSAVEPDDAASTKARKYATRAALVASGAAIAVAAPVEAAAAGVAIVTIGAAEARIRKGTPAPAPSSSIQPHSN